MTYLPELRASLVRAAERERSGADPRPREPDPRRRAGRGWLSVVAAVGVAIAVVVLAVVLVGHPRPAAPAPATPPPAVPLHTPVGPPEPIVPPAHAKLMHNAQKSVVAHDPACSASRPLPAFLSGSPPASMTSILGALRRPATAADSLPRSVFQNWPRGIYVNAIRRVLSVDGVTLYVVPAAGPGFRVVPSRCLREEIAALMRELKGSPQHVVAAAFKLQTQSFAWQQYRARYPGTLGMVITGGHEGGTATIWGPNAGALQHGQMGFLGVPGSRGATLWFTLVPDGVAKVTLEFRGSQPDVTLTVTNNGWVIRRSGHLNAVKRTVWRSADGAVIRTIPAP